MKIIGTMPVRNEHWILGWSARAIMQVVDHLVILDHCSTDGSRGIEHEIITEFPGRVTVLLDDNPVWFEMAHRQRMLDYARQLGATHIIMVDADEVLTANLISTIRATIEKLPKRLVLNLPWIALARGVDKFYASGVWSERFVSAGFVDLPEWHWKAQGEEKYDYHHRHPMGLPYAPWEPVTQYEGGLLHFQFVNERRLRAKQAAYQVDEVLRWPGRQRPEEIARLYGRAVYESDPAVARTAPVKPEWLAGYEGLMERYFHPEAEPWQEAVVRRAIATHGRGRFKALDLFGVA
jgi:hypothetical protein